MLKEIPGYVLVLAVVVILAITVILWFIGTYNHLVRLRNRVRNAWGQIEVQLQRRLDLIPNLVATVKGAAGHEKDTLESVTKARSALQSATTTKEQLEADNMISASLRSLFAVAEAYPQLQANSTFIELQAQLQDTEDKVSYMRQSFNDSVLHYNDKVIQFPSSIVARIGKFNTEEVFEADSGSHTAPKVEF